MISVRPLLLIFPVIGIAAQEQSICMEEDEADASEMSRVVSTRLKRPVTAFVRKESEIRSGRRSKRISMISITFRRLRRCSGEVWR